MGAVLDIEWVLERLDPGTAQQVRDVLPWLLFPGPRPGSPKRGTTADLNALTQLDVQRFLWQTLPRELAGRLHEQHEVAWAVGDFLEAAGLERYAALARDRRTHEVISAWSRDPGAGARAAAALQRASGVQPPDTPMLRFSEVLAGKEARVHSELSRILEREVVEGRLDPTTEDGRRRARALTESFLTRESADYGGVTPRAALLRERSARWVHRVDPEIDPFWTEAVVRTVEEPAVPVNLELSTGPAEALLKLAEQHVALAADGHLPLDVVLELDTRFGWTDKLPTGRPGHERHVPALLFLDVHLRAQQLMTRLDGRLALTEAGRACLVDPTRLWQALVSPGPRWDRAFEQDALAVMAAALLRRSTLSGAAITDQTVALLSRRWGGDDPGALRAGVEWLRVEWYRLGVGLSWWGMTRRPDHYRLSEFGRAAAAELFWAVAATPLASDRAARGAG